MNFAKGLFVMFAGLLFAGTLRAEDGASARINAVIDRAIEEHRIVGTVVLVARDGEVVYRRAAGWANREESLPMTEEAAFRLSSLTKPIVATATLALVDQGKLGLEDPVARWIPDFRPKLPDGRVPEITVRYLLTHTAGLSYGFLEPADGPYHRLGVSDGLDHSPVSLTENVRRIAAAPLLYEPGKGWGYSVAMDVLGEVLERATGKPLPEVVRETVTAPLGMTHTAFVALPGDLLAKPYFDARPEPVPMADPQSIPFGASAIVFSPSRAHDATAFPSGGAGMIGTAGDYLRLLEALRTGGGSVLRPKTVRAMTSSAIGSLPIIAGPGWTWGLGFSLLADPAAAKSPLHAGSWQWGGVYGHTWWVDPAAKLSVVILTNTAIEGMAGKFPDEIKAAVYAER